MGGGIDLVFDIERAKDIVKSGINPNTRKPYNGTWEEFCKTGELTKYICPSISIKKYRDSLPPEDRAKFLLDNMDGGNEINSFLKTGEISNKMKRYQKLMNEAKQNKEKL